MEGRVDVNLVKVGFMVCILFSPLEQFEIVPFMAVDFGVIDFSHYVFSFHQCIGTRVTNVNFPEGKYFPYFFNFNEVDKLSSSDFTKLCPTPIRPFGFLNFNSEFHSYQSSKFLNVELECDFISEISLFDLQINNKNFFLDQFFDKFFKTGNSNKFDFVGKSKFFKISDVSSSHKVFNINKGNVQSFFDYIDVNSDYYSPFIFGSPYSRIVPIIPDPKRMSEVLEREYEQYRSTDMTEFFRMYLESYDTFVNSYEIGSLDKDFASGGLALDFQFSTILRDLSEFNEHYFMLFCKSYENSK